MPDLKISLITVTFNAGHTINRCIQSVLGQTFKNFEYIVIDGGSTDDTLEIIKQYQGAISILLSEPDNGIYDAMNKGIKLATGDIIGMLNADDSFYDEKILSTIDSVFKEKSTDIVYGDIDYVNKKGAVVRKWRSGKYWQGKFNWGWMPPHPSFYCKKKIFEQFGYYSLQYGTAGDYELMLRFMHLHKIRAIYIEKVMVKMEIGGASNKNVINRVKGWLADVKAMHANSIRFPFLTVFFKPLRKILQYF